MWEREEISQRHVAKSCPHFSERMRLEDAEKSLAILNKLATNGECLQPIMEGIHSFVLGFLAMPEPNSDTGVDKLLTDLFNQLILVSSAGWGLQLTSVGSS